MVKEQIVSPKSNRLESVDMLRGIAALSVCVFHFSVGNPALLSEGFWLKRILSYGHLGVEMFFIISGFVIPYSLYKINHQYKYTKSFLLRRILRVDPPYLATIVIIITLNYISMLSPYYRGLPYHIDYYNLIIHFGYINTIVGQPWLSPVFWTLAIEFQFYLIMALIFPLIINKNYWISIPICLLFVSTFFIFNNQSLVFSSSLFFVLGILTFYYHIAFLNKKIILTAIALLILLIYHYNSIAVLCVSIFTFLTIAFVKNWSNKYLLFLGSISYSVYLLHVTIGGRIINLSLNFLKGDYIRIMVILFSLLITILISYLFYRTIELPSVILSKKHIKNPTMIKPANTLNDSI